jgi:hypothetical protein
MLGGMQLLLVAQENQLRRPDPSPFKPPKIGPDKRHEKNEVELIWCCGDSIFVRSCPADGVRPQAGEFQLFPLRQFA